MTRKNKLNVNSSNNIDVITMGRKIRVIQVGLIILKTRVNLVALKTMKGGWIPLPTALKKILVRKLLKSLIVQNPNLRP